MKVDDHKYDKKYDHIRCYVCKSKFTSKASLMKHVLSDHPKDFEFELSPEILTIFDAVKKCETGR